MIPLHGKILKFTTYLLARTKAGINKALHLTLNKKFWEEFTYFPYIGHLFDVLEPNLMQLNLSELT
jgi:hypothetical protein